MEKSILVLHDLSDEQFEDLKETAPGYDLVCSIEEAEPEKIGIVLGWSDKVSQLVGAENSQVKWIQYPYAGVNKLPLKLLEEKNVLLTNGSGIHKTPVTETTMGMILGMTRKIVESARNQAQAEWVPEGNLYELNGKTMLIAGAGQIGVYLGKVAQAFGMKTIGINRSGSDIENMDEQYVQDELEEVIEKADIVVNILPATAETDYLFNEPMFSKMKDGVIFVNVGRGETVNTNDLLAALDSGKVMYAGLDVYEEEPLPSNHPLWKHENVLMTPHTAGNVENYSDYLYPLFKENLQTYLNNEELPQNLVGLEEGY